MVFSISFNLLSMFLRVGLLLHLFTELRMFLLLLDCCFLGFFNFFFCVFFFPVLELFLDLFADLEMDVFI